MAGHSPSKTGVNALMCRPSRSYFPTRPKVVNTQRLGGGGGGGGGPRLRLRRRRPVAKGEEADAFHGGP